MTSTMTSPDQAATRPVDLPDNAGRAAMGIAIVLTAQLMFILDATVVNVALPQIDADLGFGPASLSWVLNGFTLAFGGLLLLGGRLGDVFGRRRLFLGGVAVFTLASLLGGLAQTPEWLVAARAAQGVGAAMAAPGVLALLTTSAPDEPARLRALALFGAVSSGGMSLGLLLGGAVTDLGSWRWTLFINVPIGLAILALTRRLRRRDAAPARPVRRRRRVQRHRRRGRARLDPDRRTRARLDLGAHRARLRWPAPRCSPCWRSPSAGSRTRCCGPPCCAAGSRVGGLATIGLVVGGQLSMFFLAVQFIERELGFGPMASGLAFLPLTLGIFGMSRVTPRIMALVGPLPMIVTGAVGLAASFVWLSTLDRRRRLPQRCLRPDAAQRPLGRAALHAGHLDRARRRRAGARRRGVRSAADLPAARRRGRAGGDRQRVRRGLGAGRVPARRPGGVPHLGDHGRPGRARPVVVALRQPASAAAEPALGLTPAKPHVTHRYGRLHGRNFNAEQVNVTVSYMW